MQFIGHLFLMAAKIPLPGRVYGHGWILSDEKKMSKSLGNILDPLEIIEKYGIDQLRYYLIKEVSLGNDGNVSMDSLKNCINNDLANNFGNLCQRVFSFIEKNCNSKIPSPNKFNNEDKKLLNNLVKKLPKLKELMENQELNLYIKEVINFSFDSNKYFNDLEPWNLKKSNLDRMNTVLYCVLNQIKSISILLYPIIPTSIEKIFKTMGLKKEDIILNNVKNLNLLKPETSVKKGDILFKKIENDN